MTRTDIARYLADHLESGRAEAIEQAATWLVATGRKRQVDYLAGDVAAMAAETGYLAAQVTSARALPEHATTEITNYLKRETGAKTVELSTHIDPDLIGGVCVQTPTAVMDSTVRSKLRNLAEGVSR